MINKPLYFKLLLYIIGTCMALGIFTVVGINVVNDSKWFNNKPIVQIDPSGNLVETTPDSILFRQTDTPRITQAPVTAPPIIIITPTLVPSPTEKPTAVKTTPKTTATPTPTRSSATFGPTATPYANTLIIEVINNSGDSYSGTYVVNSLMSLGHTAVLNAIEGPVEGQTMIIIRKAGVDPQIIKSVLVVGVISTELIADYPYDITVILGADFLP